MDCLDRTNVVQSVFARKIAHEQLIILGIDTSMSGAPFEGFRLAALEQAFKNIWTDNADAISIQYTGTPALKTDFTRTGKRSYKGEMNDANNSLQRYVINNFYDGYNHDCMDITSGNLHPKTYNPTRSSIGQIKVEVLATIGVMYLAQMFMNAYIPLPADSEGTGSVVILHWLVWFGTFMAGCARIYGNGYSYTDDTTR